MTTNDPVEQFLLDSIPNTLTCKQRAYRTGRKLLSETPKNRIEYKWIKAKIERILKAIDK